MAKRDEEPKIGLERYYKKARFPELKGPVSRKPVRPLRLPKDEHVFRRKGIRLPQDRKAELERRAVPLSQIYGSLWERIVYKEFRRRRFDFDFQSGLLGGRQVLGGLVADFLVFLPWGPVIVRVQSFAFHGGHAARRKDEEDKRILETLKDPYTQKHYVVYDLWEDTIADAERLAEWVDRNLLGNYLGQGLRAPWARSIWMPKQEEWDALVATVANQQVMLAEIFERLNALWLGLATGDVVPEITISEENIEADSVTANKINVGTLSAIAANMGVLTAGEIDMYTGTWDDDATGFRLTASEICGQNAGTDQVIIQSSDGKLTAGAGDVILDADGVTLQSVSDYESRNAVKWDLGGHTGGDIYSAYGGTSPNRNCYIYVRAHGEGSGSGLVYLEAGNIDFYLSEIINGACLVSPFLRLNTAQAPIQFADSATEIWEDASSNLSFKDANAGTKTLTQLASISDEAVASENLTLSTTNQDVVGATLSLGAGTWIIIGHFDFATEAAAGYAIGDLDVGGADESAEAVLHPNAIRANISQTWRVVLGSTTTCKLQARKTTDGGTATCYATHSKVVAIRTGD